MTDDGPATISIFGLKLPVSKWSYSGFSVLALIAVALFIYKQTIPPQDLVSQKQANAQLSFEVNEYGRHLYDSAERVFVDPDGSLNVQVYKDHCVIIQRKVSGGTQTKLIPDPTRVVGPLTSYGFHEFNLLPVVSAYGNCLNSHPGAFQWKYGNRNGCAVEVWRQFDDGCVHVQWLNTCNGTWDSNPDGSARVRWTNCVH